MSVESLPSLNQRPPVTHRAVFDWLMEACNELRGSNWSPLFDLDGIDALDAMVSPLYMAILAAARQKSAPQSRSLIADAKNQVYNVGYRSKIWLREQWANQRSSVGNLTDILWWPRDRTHTANCIPVMSALRRRGALTEVVTCQAAIFEQVRKQFSSVIFMPRVWPVAVRRAKAAGRRRAKRIANAPPVRLPLFAPRPELDLMEVLRAAIHRTIPLATLAAVNAQQAFKHFKPRLFVAGNDITLEGRIGTIFARLHGVRTACLMHGSITDDPIQGKHLSDKLLAYGPAGRDEFLSLGLAPERIEISGAPYLDNRVTQSNRIHPQIARRLHLQPTQPYVLVATSGAGHRISLGHHQQVIRHLLQLTRDLPQVTVLAKLHPKDHPQIYQKLAVEFPGNRLHVVPAGTSGYPNNILDWLQGASVVLTGASTTAIEAMLMEVPVITMDFADELGSIDFIKAGATTHVTDYPALLAATRERTSGTPPTPGELDHAQQYLASCFAYLEQGASQRAATLLQEMLAAKPASLSSPSHVPE